jgi:Sugar transferases involved in lipopolysaccharide synthesis
VKRLFDVIASATALVVLFPLLLVLALLIRCKMGWPVFFGQVRPGCKGHPFTLYKFRTMDDRRDVHGQLLPDADRLSSFGRFLRAFSLDELPELWNVLKDDMSLVGPRPLLMQYLVRYTPEQARRHEVKPGITGWAQVNGRNAITWEEKFKLDVWYVDNWSLLLDIKILVMTIWKIMKREGISQPGQSTMEEFKGAIAMENDQRFAEWQYPEIEEGKPTKYNWVVQNKDGFRLGYKTDIGAFTYINAKNGVTIEDFVQIGSHCSIYSISTIDEKTGHVKLKKGCRVGSHSVVMPGVTIGENAVVGAFSFVNVDIPDNSIAYGVPVKVAKTNL